MRWDEDLPKPIMVRVTFTTHEDTRELIEQAAAEDKLTRGEWLDLTLRDILDRRERKKRRAERRDSDAA